MRTGQVSFLLVYDKSTADKPIDSDVSAILFLESYYPSYFCLFPFVRLSEAIIYYEKKYSISIAETFHVMMNFVRLCRLDSGSTERRDWGYVIIGWLGHMARRAGADAGGAAAFRARRHVRRQSDTERLADRALRAVTRLAIIAAHVRFPFHPYATKLPSATTRPTIQNEKRPPWKLLGPK